MIASVWTGCGRGIVYGVASLGVAMIVCGGMSGAASAGQVDGAGGMRPWRAGVAGLNPLLQKKDDSGKRGGRGVDRRRRGGTRPIKTDRKKATPSRPVRPSRNRGGRVADVPSVRTSEHRGASETVSSRLNIEGDDLGKSPEERTYSFSIVDGSYKDLVENFARMAGIGVLGEAPVGTLSFVSSEKMDFKSALNRVRLLLFKYKPLEPYWLIYVDHRFEVLRVTDVWRYIPLDHIFMNVASFEASTIEENDLAMLLYTPTDTSVADFTLLRDFMPDYVRIAPMEKTNSLSIFALVSDIKKYLSLIKLFEGAGEDPRVLTKLPVAYLTPSKAVETLRRLMDDLDDGASSGKPVRRPSRAGAPSIDLPGQRTILFPDDAQEVIIVRAVPKKIDDIKEMLTFIDVDFGTEEIDPVLIPIEHADVDEIINIIKPLLSRGGMPVQRTAGVRGARGRGKKAAKPSVLKTDDLVLIPNTRTNTLVVVAPDEELERVRRYVKLFDVPVEEGRPVFVTLEHSEPDSMAAIVTQVVTGTAKSRPKAGETAFNVIAEPKSNALILIGPREDIVKAKDIIAQLDVDHGKARLHSYQLLNAAPSTVKEVIQMIDTQTGFGGSVKRKPSRGRPGAKAHLYTDEGLRILYVFCTDEEWDEKYLPLAQSLDQQAEQPATHVSIRVENRTADEVIATLTALFGPSKKGGAGKVRFASASDDVIVVSGATPAEVSQIRAIITDVDLETTPRDRRLFTLRHADPNEVKTIISTVVAGAPRALRRGQKAPAGPAGVVVAVLDRTLVVSGTTEELDDVAELIERLDVAQADEHQTRVYTVAPGRDVENIVGLLEALLIPGGPKTRPTKGGKSAAMFDDVRVVAHAATRRILVSAPVERFEDIESKLDLLLAGEAPEVSLIKFIPVEHADAGEVAALIEPILQMRMSELVSSGELALPSGAVSDPKRRAMAKRSGISVTPDVGGERVIVTAPSAVMAEAESLIAELDRPSHKDERIMRTITLTRSDATEMVSTINAMLTGQRVPPKPKRPQLRKGRGDGKRAAGASGGTEEVTIIAAPGASAVVLRGSPDAVDEVEGWVRHLDDTATTDTTLKIYHIRNAEIDQLADTIMDLCDTGAPKLPKRGRSDPLGLDFEPVSNVRKGGEITLTTDYWNRIILVRATPMKIFEIDKVVELYDGTEDEAPVLSSGTPAPYLIYELQTVDAFDATIELESLLDVLWTHGEPPEVDYISGTNNLVVKCLPEYNSEIEQYIKEWVDKESERSKRKHSIVYETVTGANASELAALLKLRMPDVKVNLEQLGEDLPAIDRLSPYRPCVLPLSLIDAMGGMAVSAVGQTGGDASDREKKEAAAQMMRSLAGESAKTPSEEAPPATDEAPAESKAPPEVTVRFDDRQGVIVIEGPPRAVDDVKDVLEEIQEEIESAGSKPDIRMFRIRYRNVSVAASILETMFNAAKTPRQQAQAAAQQLRMQQMQARVAQMQKQRGQPGGKPGQPPPVPGAGDGGKEEEKKKGTGQIRVFPDPQTRSLIIRAATEDFPVIIELLATIDRPPDVTNEFRIFQLKQLAASDVEEQLKVLLGVGQQRGRRQPTKRRPNRRGGAQNAAMQRIEDALLSSLAGGDVGAIDASSDIKITSNEKANTLLVMAPEPALDLIGDFIAKLEAQDIPQIVRRMYTLKHADATEVVAGLKEVFGQPRRGGGGKGRGRAAAAPATTSVSFTADTRTNTVIVSAVDKDFADIEALIGDLDRPMDDGAAVQTYVLRNADAAEVARTLGDVFGGGRGRGRGRKGGGDGAKTARFVGDAGSNTLFVTAPAELREQIATHIENLDAQAGERAKPKVIVLKEGKASEVANALQEAFGARGRHSSVKIVGNDLSNQLIVTAPEDLFTEIAALASTMDQSSMSISTRVFRLEHARAVEVHKQLMDIVHQLGSQMRNRKGMDVFTAVADERSNTIVCVGGPVAFGLVEQVIREVDVPESEAGTRVRKLVTLEHAEAADLARVINEELRNTQRPAGGRRQSATSDAVSVIANEALNALLVSGLNEDVDDVLGLISEMDLPAVDQDRVTRVYAVNYADPGSLVGTINGMFQQRRGMKPEDMVDVSYDWGTSKLVVTAIEENHEKVVRLLADVDDASVNVRSERTITLQYANADELSRNLQQLFRQTVRGQRGQQVMTIAGDVGTNSLIVYANDAEFERVRTLVNSLDKRPEESRQRMIKGIKLANANPWAVKTAITSLFRSRSRNPLDEVSAVEEWDTMSVIVSASPENMAKVEAFIAEMDQPSASDSRIHVIDLEHADGAAVHRALQEMFSRQRGRGQDPRGAPVQISNPQGTNTILVKANNDDFAEISAVIAELDSVSSEAGEIEVVALQHSDAESMKDVLETYLSKPGQRGGRNAALRGDVRISANAQNNTLIISGDSEEVTHLKEVVAELDREVEGASNAPRIVTLKHARASQIEPLLTQMFVDAPRRGGRGGRGSSVTPPPVIAADDVGNTLIVRAGASDFTQIMALIDQLDTENAASQEYFTILPVAEGVQVEELAQMVETTINEGERIKADRWGVDPGTVVVTADKRAGALVVAGSASLFPDVEQLVRRMEGMGPIGGRRMRVLDPTNISPDELKRLLEQVIDENTSSQSRGSRAQSRRPGGRQPSQRGPRNQRRQPPRRGGAKRGR